MITLPYVIVCIPSLNNNFKVFILIKYSSLISLVHKELSQIESSYVVFNQHILILLDDLLNRIGKKVVVTITTIIEWIRLKILIVLETRPPHKYREFGLICRECHRTIAAMIHPDVINGAIPIYLNTLNATSVVHPNYFLKLHSLSMGQGVRHHSSWEVLIVISPVRIVTSIPKNFPRLRYSLINQRIGGRGEQN